MVRELFAKQSVICNKMCRFKSYILLKYIGVIQWVECCIWDAVVTGSSPVIYT